MDVQLEPGVYVVAVSGGVDSMVLLDVLRKRPDLTLVVAHFDHGIRPDSAQDKQLVQARAAQYGLSFVYHEGQLGPGASEDEARQARYAFLHTVRQASGARAVVTAHHQDDMLETAVHNLLRGTGRTGFAALRSTDVIKRPLLPYPKSELQQYAHDNMLTWREDSTNQDPRYTRNYIRLKLLPRLPAEAQRELLERIKRVSELNQEIDQHLAVHLHVQPGITVLDRQQFITLPHVVARELMASWLRQNGIRDFSKKTIERLVHAAKTYPAGSRADITAAGYLQISRDRLALKLTER